MPTYQYACPDCGNKFELKQKFTDDPVRKCPRCERRHVYRVVGPVAVTFKGTGWYITDSKKSSNGTNGHVHGNGNGKHEVEHSEQKEPAASANGTGENKSSEGATKPETKSETKAADTTTKSAPEKTAAPAKKT